MTQRLAEFDLEIEPSKTALRRLIESASSRRLSQPITTRASETTRFREGPPKVLRAYTVFCTLTGKYFI